MTDKPQPYDCGACESPVACLWADRCKAHPDQSGSHAAAAEINAARDEMLKGVQ